MKKIIYSVTYMLIWYAICVSTVNTVNAETAVPQVNIELVSKLIQEGRCQEAWETLWKNASQGSGEAYAALAQALDAGALIPPAVSADREKILRDISYFSLKALAISDSTKQSEIYSFPSFLNIMDNLLPNYFESHGSSDFLKRCGPPQQSWSVCSKDAAAEGYITSDREFLQELKAAYALGMEAQCFAIGYNHPQLDRETVPLTNSSRIQNNGR